MTKNKMPTKAPQSEMRKIPKLRFPGFSGGWEEKKLGEVGKIVTGSTPATATREFYGGTFMFVSPAGIGTAQTPGK